MAVHRPADDVVDERQVPGRQSVKRFLIAALRGDDRGEVGIGPCWSSHHN
jgi:hypothetical protein